VISPIQASGRQPIHATPVPVPSTSDAITAAKAIAAPESASTSIRTLS